MASRDALLSSSSSTSRPRRDARPPARRTGSELRPRSRLAAIEGEPERAASRILRIDD
ncbi:MAG: hypothetical protein JHC24_01850, partial [Thaumarchaeota archaeon]|nr:hypothetical protein [Nitrososphaerota archaeon]